VLIAIPDPQYSLQQSLDSHPRLYSHGPWAGTTPSGWFAKTSPEEHITIPDTTIRLLDSEPVLAFESMAEKEHPELTIKLVGYGHGIILILKGFIFRPVLSRCGCGSKIPRAKTIRI
jgi:hypothetical protein